MRNSFLILLAAACGDAPPGTTEEPGRHLGSIVVGSGSFVANGAAGAITSASASFVIDDTSGVTCAEETAGDCVARNCAGIPDGTRTLVSVGVVEVTGGALAVTLSPGAQGQYAPFFAG